jgi:transposase
MLGQLKDIFSCLFSKLSSFTDTEWTFIDASFVKAHQHSSGAAGQESQAIGQSVGGKTSKIHLAVDAYGLPVTFEITGGDVHESQVAPLLIERLPHAEATVADKGYDSTSIRALIQSKGSKVVIPRKKNSTIGNAALDVYLYKLRHLVENMFCKA